MEDSLEPGSALRRLTERIEHMETGQGRHGDKLDSFRDGLHGVEEDVVKLSDEVTHVRQEIAGLESAVTDTRQTLDTFIEQYGRDREVSKAQAELSRLTTEWHATFAQRKQTRALARGLVHTLTAQAVYRNVVNTATVRASSEERLLLEPTYWLAPATMAVAAKFRNEEEQGERARAHACALDAAKANLFFSLTCSRLGDDTEAAAWMDLYLQSLDPNELGQDFLVVLDAIAGKELGAKALGYTQQAMARWNRGNSALSTSGYTASKVRGGAHLESRLLDLRSRLTESRYKALRETCGDQWEGLRNGWELSTVADRTLSHLDEMFPDGFDEADTVDTPVRSGVHVESALERLIDQLEPDEGDMREKMRRLERVIEYGGDLGAAGRAHDSSLALDTAPVALMTLLDQAVFEPEQVRLGQSARRMALHAIWPSLEEAAQRVVTTSRDRLPRHITLTVGAWSYSVPTDPRLMVEPDRVVAELALRIEQQTQGQSDAVVRRWPRVIAALTIGALTGALLTPFVDVTARWIFGLLTIGMFSWASWEMWSIPLRKKRVRYQGVRLRHEAVTKMAKALSQCEDFFEDWRDALDRLDFLIQWGGTHKRD
ncbi:hypothetical protein J7E97_22155 [Streptomyces sp. ISL-66]|uniref:hypothetical protein n=1 Tax=Streptomyces sp. ISL-66 TaxID=2819186 RepID=UPI001BE736A8|nr:hypothetical protein [Streptomyces sp. ISL-66]MBT2470503.1 hypothetical protein [Streptomyces sp. ISL-66]